MAITIKIPDSFDDEWQRKMIREIRARLKVIDAESLRKDAADALTDIYDICDALGEYQGY